MAGTRKAAEAKATQAVEADAGAEPGSPEHLGERPYADEPTEQGADVEGAAPGSPEHLGESPYAGAIELGSDG
jgi:hypothetical protein